MLTMRATQNVSYTTCGAPIRDRSRLVSGFGAGGGAVALLVYLTRIFAKYTVPAARFGYDDLSITIAMVRIMMMMHWNCLLTRTTGTWRRILSPCTDA